MVVTFAGRTTDSARFLSRGGRILPGSSTTFWHSSVPLDPPVTAFPSTGRVKFVFEYGDDQGRATREIAEAIAYTVDGAAPGSRTNWLFVDESQTAS